MKARAIQLANSLLEILLTVASDADCSDSEKMTTVVKRIFADASLSSALASLTPMEEGELYLLLRRESEARGAPRS